MLPTTATVRHVSHPFYITRTASHPAVHLTPYFKPCALPLLLRAREHERMMMMGKRVLRDPTVDVLPWPPFDDQPAGKEFRLPVSGISSGQVAGDFLLDEVALAELQCYVPFSDVAAADGDEDAELADPPVDAYSCDEFRMYNFKVRRCGRGRSHDWTECPYAHPGEKARRRDPRKHHYSGTACPEFRKGSCKKGDACEFSHGVFECWLHPARYRTQPCKDGTACRRRVCFFAHTPEQLRVIPPQQMQSLRAMNSYDGSPLRQHATDAYFHKGFGQISSSPTSTLISPPADSPPISPIVSGIRRSSWPTGSKLSEVLESMRNVHLSKVLNPMNSSSFSVRETGLGSPVGRRPAFFSLPSTPTGSQSATRGWLNLEGVEETDDHIERVKSGHSLRDKMYDGMNKDAEGDGANADLSAASVAAAVAPDFGWVAELIK